MRRIAMGLIVLCLAGCQAKEPALLAAGTEFMLMSGTPDIGVITSAGLVPAGSRVRVSHDPGPVTDSTRKVAVICLDGPFRDRTMNVTYFELKPL